LIFVVAKFKMLFVGLCWLYEERVPEEEVKQVVEKDMEVE